MRQTFLEPVEWQVSAIREAFLSSLSRDSFFGHSSSGSSSPQRAPRSLPGSSDPPGTTGPFPRPSVLAEIIQGDAGSGCDASQGFAGEEEAGEGRGTGGRVEGRRKQGEQNKDFDFREAFAVYEDRDLVACSPLREVCCGLLDVCDTAEASRNVQNQCAVAHVVHDIVVVRDAIVAVVVEDPCCSCCHRCC